MLQTVPSDTLLPFEVTYDPGLFVGIRVSDTTGGVSTLIDGPVLMDEDFNGTYLAWLTFEPEKTYLVTMAVYHDSGLTSLNNAYVQNSGTYAASSATALVPADIQAVVDGVWNQAVVDNDSPDTFGQVVQDALSEAVFNANVDTLLTEIDTRATHQYVNRMTTVYRNITADQEILTWAEFNGERRTDTTDCTITVFDSQANEIWTATAPTPSTDGIFRFVNSFTTVADQNFYVVISIVVDGLARKNQQPFFSVG